MHRATPANSSFRSYSAGGARATIDKADDSKLMQETKAGFQKGENRSAIESPQNYGFTSCNAAADDSGSAEAFVNFIGGNRSFPAMGPIDDRRHRLCDLSEGDSAMHRGKDDDMQIHLASDGLYHSAPQMVRVQLVPPGSAKRSPPQSQSKPQQSQPAAQLTAFQRFAFEAEARDAAGGGGSGSSTGQQQQGENKATGQKAVNSAGKDSSDFMHVKKGEARLSSKDKVRLSTGKDDGDTLHESGSGKDYVGGTPAKHKFSKILTLAGPSTNGMGRID